MKNVVSLKIAQMTRAVEAGSIPWIPTSFDTSDVTRLTQDDDIPRMDDPVVFGPTAAPQIQKMLAAMGQSQTPKTFAELFGMYRLGVFINAKAPVISTSLPEVVRREMLNLSNKHMPGVSGLLECLQEGRLQDAARWHQEHQSMTFWADWYKAAFSGSGQGA
jgi:hypothetical protein